MMMITGVSLPYLCWSLSNCKEMCPSEYMGPAHGDRYASRALCCPKEGMSNYSDDWQYI